MKIRGPQIKPAQNRAYQPADILALAADHGAAGICDHVSPPCERALRASQRENTWPGNVENRRTIGARIADADVERCLDGMIAHHGCVVTAAAESRNARDVQVVVAARNTRGNKFCVVEQFFAARNLPTLGGDCILAIKPQPRPIQVKDLRGERGVGSCDHFPFY